MRKHLGDRLTLPVNWTERNWDLKQTQWSILECSAVFGVSLKYYTHFFKRMKNIKVSTVMSVFEFRSLSWFFKASVDHRNCKHHLKTLRFELAWKSVLSFQMLYATVLKPDNDFMWKTLHFSRCRNLRGRGSLQSLIVTRHKECVSEGRSKKKRKIMEDSLAFLSWKMCGTTFWGKFLLWYNKH